MSKVMVTMAELRSHVFRHDAPSWDDLNQIMMDRGERAADRIEALEAQNREQALQMLSDAGQFCDLHDRIKAADALAEAAAGQGRQSPLSPRLRYALVQYRKTQP